jgi:hypothetical protein
MANKLIGQSRVPIRRVRQQTDLDMRRSTPARPDRTLRGRQWRRYRGDRAKPRTHLPTRSCWEPKLTLNLGPTSKTV